MQTLPYGLHPLGYRLAAFLVLRLFFRRLGAAYAVADAAALMLQSGKLCLGLLNARLADKQLRCELTPEAKQFIIDAAYDPQYGARPLRRYLQHTVETLLARRIVEGNVSPGATLRVEVRDDALQVV